MASSCCIAPLVLFSLGISGAWIGNLTALAPYQPYFIAATLACLGYGYWLVFRPRKVACAEGAACARPPPNRFVMLGLILATILVAGALGFDLLAPLIKNRPVTRMLVSMTLALGALALPALAGETTVKLAVRSDSKGRTKLLLLALSTLSTARPQHIPQLKV